MLHLHRVAAERPKSPAVPLLMRRSVNGCFGHGRTPIEVAAIDCFERIADLCEE